MPLVLRPASTAEVASVVRICAEAGVGIVPQGGNTGLTGGSQPHADMSEVIVSTSRLNRIRAIDTVNDTITVEAGVVLKEIQNAADRADRLFPLSLGAEGSCQIGGNISTNAGGVQRAALRQHAQSRARAGGGAARRQRLGRPARACARTIPATT